MARTEITVLLDALDAAYQTDRWHAILRNLSSVTDAEWDLRPADHSIEVFGTRPELSVADLVRHVAGAVAMYTNRGFEDGTMTWERIQPPGSGRSATMEWFEANVRAMETSLGALIDDTDLDLRRETHWGELLPVRQFVTLTINHMLYHSGEINRQLSLIRGTSGGWVPGDVT
jgi:uncharacterized damage-inducible protein DinB